MPFVIGCKDSESRAKYKTKSLVFISKAPPLRNKTKGSVFFVTPTPFDELPGEKITRHDRHFKLFEQLFPVKKTFFGAILQLFWPIFSGGGILPIFVVHNRFFAKNTLNFNIYETS